MRKKRLYFVRNDFGFEAFVDGGDGELSDGTLRRRYLNSIFENERKRGRERGREGERARGERERERKRVKANERARITKSTARAKQTLCAFKSIEPKYQRVISIAKKYFLTIYGHCNQKSPLGAAKSSKGLKVERKTKIPGLSPGRSNQEKRIENESLSSLDLIDFSQRD